MGQTESAADLLERARRVGLARKALLLEGFTSYPRFCGLLKIVPKTGERQRLTLNEIQKLYCSARTKRDILLKARQVGMTTEELARDVWHFLTVPGARVVITCQSMTGDAPKKELSTKLRLFFTSLREAGLLLNFRTASGTEWVLADRDAVMSITEAGASEASAQKKGRAGTITRLHASEVSFYEYAGDTLNAMLECVPGVATGSEVVFESTPNGASGVFYEQWQAAVSGKSGYKPHFFPWFLQREYRIALEPGEHIVAHTDREKTLSPEQIKWYRQKVAQKGQALTDQEYPSDSDTCFLATGRSFFDLPTVTALIAKARKTEPVSMFHVKRRGANGILALTKLAKPTSHGDAIELGADATVRVWKEPEKGSRYLIALDPSQGVGGDNAAGIVLERGTGHHVATLWGNLKPEELARLAVITARSYNDAEIAPERNNHGHACILALGIGHSAIGLTQPWPNVFVDLDGYQGWNTSPTSRVLAIDVLDEAVRLGHVKTFDVELLGEMLSFVQDEKGKIAAAAGAKDDLVLGLAIGWSAICRRQAPRADLSALPPR